MTTSSQSIQQALAASPMLQALRARGELGQARMHLVQQMLSPQMAQQLRSGICDESEWCILVPNTAVAAKLRQWLPDICSGLMAQEHRTVQVRIKVSHAT